MDKENITYIAYAFYSVDDKANHEFFAIIPERRQIPQRRTRESILKWRRMAVCDPYGVKRIYYVRKVLTKQIKRLTGFKGVQIPQAIPKRNNEDAFKGH